MVRLFCSSSTVICFEFTRCYVGDSNTCSDARTSVKGAPFSWSCQACRNKKKEDEY